jgi:hypothetical protein
MVVLASESRAKVLQFTKLRNELFNPKDLTNAATDKQLVQLAKALAQGIMMSCTRRRGQLGSICLYWDLLFPIRDVQWRLRKDCRAKRLPMIGARVHWFYRNGNTTKGMFNQFEPKMCECVNGSNKSCTRYYISQQR